MSDPIGLPVQRGIAQALVLEHQRSGVWGARRLRLKQLRQHGLGHRVGGVVALHQQPAALGRRQQTGGLYPSVRLARQRLEQVDNPGEQALCRVGRVEARVDGDREGEAAVGRELLRVDGDAVH